jgi:hypothetical protein
MAQYIVKSIPGNPANVVQNMPGAGNIIGANYVYRVAKPDGLTLGAVNPALYFDQLVGRSEVKFDWQIQQIGCQKEASSPTCAPTTIQVDRDLRQAKPKVQHRHRLHRPYIRGSSKKPLIKSDRQRYPGAGVSWPSARRFFAGPASALTWREPYWRWHKSGYVRVLLQTGLKRDPRLKDVPTLNELMQQYKTPEAGHRLAKVILTAATLGRPIGATPGTPADRVKTLREAYAKAIADPELLAEATKRKWEVDPTRGEELQALSKEVIVQPREVIERMKWVLGRE